MVINVTRNKHLYAQQLMSQINTLEMKMFRKIRALLNKTFYITSDMVKHGDYLNIVPIAVNKYSQDLRMTLRTEYRRIGSFNFDSVGKRLNELRQKNNLNYNKKDAENNFWYFYTTWLNQQALTKSTIIDTTTKKILRNIINKGIREGKSYAKIAKEITNKTKLNKNRAMMIAITETHTAFNKSIFESIENYGVKMETKEWLNAGDERVRDMPFNHRAANGEKVPMHEHFIKTGGKLMYPGDISSEGSVPANIIRCRCVTLYNTEVTEIE